MGCFFMKIFKKTNQNINEVNDELYFYNSCYNAIENIEKIYLPNFYLKNMFSDIVSADETQSQKTFFELLSLKNLIISALIGLNKEELESANSLVYKNQLFQYRDYESDIDLYINGENNLKWKDYAKQECDFCGFNPNQEGPFPLMLEITKDNNKTRPYDYISKIRNAYLHAEYKLNKDNPNITDIWNTDEYGNVFFEGKILSSNFIAFVMDYFGFSNSIGSKYIYYQFDVTKPNLSIDELFSNMKCFSLKFIEIPSKYKFHGQKGGIFEQLNFCFDKDNIEIKDIYTQLIELEKEGVKYDVDVLDFPVDKLNPFFLHILKNKKTNDYYNLKNMMADAKLIFSPISEITNCFTNINHYIDFKINYLLEKRIEPIELFCELKKDEDVSTSFKYTIAFLKLHLINYAIESKNIKEFDYDLLDLSGVSINNLIRFNERKKAFILEGYSEKGAQNKLILEIMRNSLAHGGDRIEVSLGDECKVKFIDKYQNLSTVSVEISLEKINEIFKLFNPEVFKETKKRKKLIKLL